MSNIKNRFVGMVTMCLILSVCSRASTQNDIERIRKEIDDLRQSYEKRIAELEEKLARLQQEISDQPERMTPGAPTLSSERSIYDNSFNPSIGVILNGRYSRFSEATADINGFGVGEEGERGREGLALDESELNFSANVDDKFYASLTAAVVREDGDDKVELEEGYIQTLPAFGLPTGLNLKAGRALWTLGYLNEHHGHTDDFADRPLPYRVYLNNAFNDDGIELSYVLPADIYVEIGGGAFRGDDFPGGGATGAAPESYSTFARIGGDVAENQTWRFGAYWLGTNVVNRTNEDLVTFVGDNDLYVADLRYTWAPTGNSREREITLQGEYFWRDEDGTYEDQGAPTAIIPFDDDTTGWYVQGVYKFHPQWRLGARYSQLNSADVATGLIGSSLDAGGHDPETYSVMADWTNSEFSRIRLQYNHEELINGNDDDQIIIQYILSLGAHGAHKY